jgi:multiple sugar transport system substrate-binding protein
MMKSRITKIGTALAATVAVTAALAGCTAGSPTNSNSTSTKGQTITVWSLENQPDRVTTTQHIIDAFTKKTGIKVKLVAVDDSQVTQLTESAALSGKLPDVMGAVSLAEARQFYTLKLLNTDAAAAIVKNLGAGTFVKSALALDQDGSTQIGIPDSAWAQILVYRKDLFAKAGLAPPTTYANIEAAAQKLTVGKQYGITLATDPADVFTEQTFESLALGNGCQLVSKSGKVQLDSAACKSTWALYGDLAQKYSPSGTQTVDTTRATYFAGQAAMVDWSTYILDELGGLRNDALPSCPQCKGDPQWLAKNSGIVTAIKGPDGKSSALGQASSWLVTKSSQKAAASEKFIEYMMSTGYLDWLGMAPEGKFPLRAGDASSPTKFADGWKDLDAGVDKRATLASIYDADTMKSIEAVPDNIDTWAIPQGQGALLGAVETQLTIPQVLGNFASGSISASQAAQQASDAVTQVKSKLIQ